MSKILASPASPMPINSKLMNLILRHNVFTERYKASLVNKIVGMFNSSVIPDVEQKLIKHLGNNTITELQVKKLNLDLKDINDAYGLLHQKFTGQLTDFAVSDAGWITDTLKNVVPVDIDLHSPAPAQLKALVKESYVRGKLVKDWFADLAADTRDKIIQQVNIGMVEGEGVADIVRRIKGTQAANYSDGILNASRRNIEAVVRTSVSGINNGVMKNVYQANTDVVKSVQIVATLDDRTCPICMALDGKVFDVDKAKMPPFHWNCVLPDNLVYANNIQAAHKANYSGPIIELGFSDGRSVSITINHMFLTLNGFASADSLREGDYVIDCSGFNGISLGNPDNNDSPARIDKIFQSLCKSVGMLSASVPLSPEYLHGDGRLCNGDIDIVASNSLLTDDIITSQRESICNDFLGISYSDLSGLPCIGDLDSMLIRLRDASDGGMGIRRESNTFLSRKVFHPDDISLRARTNFDAGFNQSPSNNASPDSEFVCDKQLRFSTCIKTNDFVDIERLSNSLGASDIVSFEDSVNRSSSDSNKIFNVLRGHSRLVRFARITFKRYINFSGHVYDLQTMASLYTINGIVSSNCRCATVPVSKSWKELGIDLKEAPAGTRASMDGQVPSPMKYGKWLKLQDEDTQDEILGKGKAGLFRRGKVPIEKFIDARNRPLTLKQLEKLEKRLNKAG